MGKVFIAIGVFLTGVFWIGWLSVSSGQDNNFDFKNYHYYNAYSFLNGRTDFAPAQIQSFHNPLSDILPYVLLKSVSPRQFGWIIGGFQGINFLLLYLMSMLCITSASQGFRISASLIMAVLGLTGTISVSQAGTTFHDFTISPVIHLACLFYIMALRNKRLFQRNNALLELALAGFFMGFAAGLKLTFASYSLAFCIASWTVPPASMKRIRCVITTVAGVMSGFFLSYGFWGIHLFRQFKNPFFPYFNTIFRSPYVSTSSFNDHRYIPETLKEAFLFPFEFFSLGSRSAEIQFADGRLAIVYGTLIVFITWLALRFLRKRPSGFKFSKTSPSPAIWLLLFYSISYCLWLTTFAIYRYLAPLEHSAPLLVFLLMTKMCRSKTLAILITSTSMMLAFWTQTPPNWGRIDWREKYVGLTLDTDSIVPDAMVLIGTHNPLSFLVPEMPASLKFVRIQSNFHDLDVIDSLFEDAIDRAIRNHRGRFYLLTRIGNNADSDHILKEYGLERITTQAIQLDNHLDGSAILYPLNRYSRFIPVRSRSLTGVPDESNVKVPAQSSLGIVITLLLIGLLQKKPRKHQYPM